MYERFDLCDSGKDDDPWTQLMNNKREHGGRRRRRRRRQKMRKRGSHMRTVHAYTHSERIQSLNL